MAVTQNLHHDSSDLCSKCGESPNHVGSELPPENGKRRYLCQPCTELRHSLKKLVNNQEEIDWAMQQVKVLTDMEESSLLASDDISDYYQEIRNEIYEARVSLQLLIREAQTEQPWD